jgi:hypothetical protein
VTQSLLKPLSKNPSQKTLPKGQITLDQEVATIPPDDRLQLDQLAALTDYGDGRPFTLFESPYMKAFLKKLNPSYSPPSRNHLDSSLLEETYEEVRGEVDSYLREATTINIIFDETISIAGKRVINLTAHTERGPFFYKHILLKKGEAANAENFRKYLLPLIEELCNEDFTRINSFSTDICATMRKWWRIVKAIDELSHCLFISCDSHGLQLLIKDIVELPIFKLTMRLASNLVKSFHKSGKRLDLLHERQLRVAARWPR